MSKYKLTYFEAKGRAEISRLIFAAAGQESEIADVPSCVLAGHVGIMAHTEGYYNTYEDKRVQEFTEPDYAKVMALKEEDRKFSEDWLALKAKTPQGHVPILEVDGVTIGQSKVIAHFLAKRFGLAGKTDLDEAKAAMIAETAEELFMSPVFGLFTEKDKEKQAAAVKKFATETIPNMMTRLEKLVGEKGFFVGDKLSYADIAFYFHSAWPAFVKVEIDYSKYPKLKAVVDHVTSNPGIAKWLKERPETFF